MVSGIGLVPWAEQQHRRQKQHKLRVLAAATYGRAAAAEAYGQHQHNRYQGISSGKG